MCWYRKAIAAFLTLWDVSQCVLGGKPMCWPATQCFQERPSAFLGAPEAPSGWCQANDPLHWPPRAPECSTKVILVFSLTGDHFAQGILEPAGADSGRPGATQKQPLGIEVTHHRG